MPKHRNGFTIIEVLMAMALVSVIAGWALINYGGQKPVRDLKSTELKVTAVLREASTRSAAQEGGVGWGVHFDASPTSSFFTLFSNSYAPGNISEFSLLPKTLRFNTSTFGTTTTIKDVSFAPVTGKANASTSIGFYLAGDVSKSSTIQISSSGLVTLVVPNSNLALNKPAAESSILTFAGIVGSADHAVDGNTDGNFFNNSVSHTQSENQPWWQVDLGKSYYIDSINVWNRTDCCTSRLSNYFVIVANVSFGSGSLGSALLTPGAWAAFQSSPAGSPTVIPVGRGAQYIRIQLAGADYLHMAEVEVLGH